MTKWVVGMWIMDMTFSDYIYIYWNMERAIDVTDKSMMGKLCLYLIFVIILSINIFAPHQSPKRDYT